MADAPAPLVRVVVLNWNNDWLTTRCVRSLLAAGTQGARLDVVVVDNGSIDGSVTRLRADLADPLTSGAVRLVENGENLGFAEGCNRAMRDLDGVDFVALINNDATVEPGWLGPLLGQMTDDRVGAVAPKLLLESPFVTVDLDELPPGGGASTDPPAIDAVRVDGVDVTARCVLEDVETVVHPDRPLEFVRRVRHGGCVHVPVGADLSRPPRIALDVTVTGPGLGVSLDGVDVVVDQPGSTTVALTSVGPRHRRINNLGTTITANTEAADRWFGVPDRDDLPAFEVPGFCGGAVLLRAAMLRQVGLFEPTFFAYYEDIDLGWRARRAGWRTVCAPDSVVNHLHGGSGSAEARGFFFLKYRNWLSTVLRNGSFRQVLTAERWAWHFSWTPTWRNLVVRPLRRSAPRPAITMAWLRVFAGVAGAVPVTAATRFGRRIPGLSATSDVRSRLQPRGRPGAPTRRPGGPVLVYVDVTPTLQSGWRAGIQRVVTTLVRELPAAESDLQLVPVRWAAHHARFRRITNDEYESLLAPTAGHQPVAHGVGSPLRIKVGDIGRGLGLAPLANRARAVRARVRRLQALRAETPEQRDLLVDRFEPGAVFFDCDAGWNDGTPERRELLGRLAADGVRVVSFVYDVFPITHPEWFDSGTTRVATAFLQAHLATDDAIICSAASVVDELAGWAKDIGVNPPDMVVTPLGFETPTRERVAPGEAPATPYVLMVGTVEPRKNHAAALSAMEQLWAGGVDVDLVVVGRAGWRNEALIERLRAAEASGRVRWFDSAGDDELEALYASAHLVVVASFSEGYGLPVVEALSRGVPVVSSTGGALPEAGGASVEYFEPTDVDRLAELIGRHVTDTAHHRVQRRLAASHVGTTWREAASMIGGALVRVGRGDSVRSI